VVSKRSVAKRAEAGVLLVAKNAHPFFISILTARVSIEACKRVK
jgi:hypothetical protein